MTKKEAINLLRANVMVACDTSDKVGYGTPLNKAIEEALNMAIRALEQPTSEDCVSRQAVDHLCFEYLKPNTDDNIAFYEHFCDLPPVTPTYCIAAVRFSKDDLREICNERIELECTHGTCKDCKHWKDSDGVYRRGIGAESKCPVNSSRVFEGTFCCADFERRGNSLVNGEDKRHEDSPFVEIGMCKDCKRYNKNEMFCTWHSGELMQKCDPDYYCANFEKER